MGKGLINNGDSIPVIRWVIFGAMRLFVLLPAGCLTISKEKKNGKSQSRPPTACMHFPARKKCTTQSTPNPLREPWLMTADGGALLRVHTLVTVSGKPSAQGHTDDPGTRRFPSRRQRGFQGWRSLGSSPTSSSTSSLCEHLPVLDCLDTLPQQKLVPHTRWWTFVCCQVHGNSRPPPTLVLLDF